MRYYGEWRREVDNYSIDDVIEWLKAQTMGSWSSTNEIIIIPAAQKAIELLDELKIRREFVENQRKNKMAEKALEALQI